jgi:hypothetical protein
VLEGSVFKASRYRFAYAGISKLAFVFVICSGQTLPVVEENFLKIVSHLDAYGIDPQPVQALYSFISFGCRTASVVQLCTVRTTAVDF